MTESVTIVVADDEAGTRLDALLARRAGVSRSRAAALVEAGAVTVDGRPVPKKHRVSPGERLDALLAQDAYTPGPAPDVAVAFEDEHLLVVDKPAGLVVHGAPGLREATVVDALRARGVPLAPAGGTERPGIVHRLDREVSGLLLVAKTDEAYQALSGGIRARSVRREYLALVVGVPPVVTGKIDAPVGRSPRHRTRMSVLADGRPAVTWFRVAETLRDVALLEVRLETGRTHQIRTHLESIGFPIAGDPVYSRMPSAAMRLGLARPFLHAFRLGFDHPASARRVELKSALPEDLQAALDKARGEART